MTILFWGHFHATELSSRPERTRISCHATLDKAACAAFRKKSRMKFFNASNFDRKSGERNGGICGFSSDSHAVLYQRLSASVMACSSRTIPLSIGGSA
jgi:hypothetical protein